MNDYPKVSIIIPLYNRVDLVGQTLDSVINQTYENWEIIVVDDGSTDGSYEYVQNLAHQNSHVKVFKRHREPKGASTCRNIGIEKASGDYIIFLDSDDILAPHCLQQRVQAFQEHQHNDFLVFPVQYFVNTVGDRDKIFFRYFYQDYITSFLLQSHWITLSPIWKKEAVVQLNGFDEKLTCMQDGDLHLRALVEGMKFKVFRENTPVDGYLRVSNSYSRISNTLYTEKLDSQAYANQKMYNKLLEKSMLTPIRIRMLAAHFLNISCNYRIIGEKEKANNLWKMIYEKDMVDKRAYLIGKSYSQVKSLPFISKSRIASGIIKRAYRLFLPKFLAWL